MDWWYNNTRSSCRHQPRKPYFHHNTHHHHRTHHHHHSSHKQSVGMCGPRYRELRRLPFNSYGIYHPYRKDMDLIEALWRQDIDMGISRDESYSFKEDLLLEKGEHPDKLKSQQQSWDHFGYNIDGETGEYVPNPPGLEVVQPQTPQPTLPQVPVQPDGNISLEDCLQLLEDEYLPAVSQPDGEQYQAPQQPLSPLEQEQRWQDLASIPELTHQLHELPHLPYQATVDMNITQPLNTQDAFAINATTNGNVNLQNATLSVNRNMLPIEPQRLDEFAPPPEVFSPLSNFANLSLSSASPTGLINGQQNLNFSSFLLPEQPLHPAMESPLPINATDNQDNSSLLMELLNTSNVEEVDPMELDFDAQIHNVMQSFGENNSSASFDGSCSGFEDMSDGSSPYHTSEDGLEGATGYNASLDGHGMNGTSGSYGYHRQRGGSSCGGDSDSGSSFSSYNSQSSKPENVKHNHTYASSSSSSGSNRSSNNSKNNSSKKDRQNLAKLSRDEKRARTLKVPVPIDKIISLPVDAFNDLLKKYELNDAQLTLIRDIRRRGKNKVAAQNCRKRKISALVSVEVNIDTLKEEKEQLELEREHIDKETSDMQSRYDQLYNEVFQNMCDEHGDPVDPNEFTLQQMPDGSMFLVPRNSTNPDKDKNTEK
ncbi:nuclear factor erythroid 2-related factor 2-like isoform X2 [Patiria miniata]|uniref:BZIP domain-containing protein n=1 Tax=Patiria miniata TaxID=46514 RepID=A0A914BMV0_PATMI|nr:nuclear factor erythroid 2-related factor 2-like isoform X2 [Patiria miniata]